MKTITAKNIDMINSLAAIKDAINAEGGNITDAIDENIVAENIKSGVTILGVEGTYTGE